MNPVCMPAIKAARTYAEIVRLIGSDDKEISRLLHSRIKNLCVEIKKTVVTDYKGPSK